MPPPSAQRATREIQSYLTLRSQRRRLYPRAALVGLAAGLLAVAFRRCLELTGTFRLYLAGLAHAHPWWGWLLPLSWGALSAAVAVFLVRRFAPEAVGSGIPHLKAVFYRLRSLHWARLLPVKFVGGVLAIGGGLALGREGPTVQMGGALGAALAQRFGSNARERLALIAAGCGAGLAAAFNAPLAGVVFVLEEVQRGFTPSVFGAALIASVTADVVSRLANGQQPVYDIPFYAVPPLGTFFLYPLLGALAGLLSVAFTRGLLLTLDGAAQLKRPLVLAAGVGGLVGSIGIFAPGVISAGHSLIEQTLAGGTLLWTIVPLLLLRYVLTLGSYSLGAPGGIFAPLLVLGALLGAGLGDVSRLAFPELGINPEALAVVGMAAFFTGVVRAPLTGLVLVIELTGNYGQMLPLMLACFTALAVAEACRLPPVYEALLARELRQTPRDSDTPDEDGTLLLTLTVQPDAPFEGRAVRDLGLLPGCILITLKRALTEQVVTADTVLEAGDEVTALVAPSAKGAVHALHEGCG